MKRFFAITSAVLLTGLLLAGCTKTVVEYEYLNLDVANISFRGDSNAPTTIKVSATGDWEVETSATWLTITEQTEDSVTVIADDNAEENEREGKLIFTMGAIVKEVPVNQIPGSLGGYVYRYPSFLDLGLAMSPNGKYVVGEDNVLQDDNTFNFEVHIYDLDRDEHRVVATFPESQVVLQKPMCITDEGLAFISTASDGIAVDIDGNSFYPEGVEGFLCAPEVQGVSAGENPIWVGYQRSKAGLEGLYYPVIWENGVARALPIPELNAHEEQWFSGIMARGCSHDGKVIYGSSWDNMEFTACYWRADDGYKFHWAAEGDWDKQKVEIVDVSGQTVTVTQLSAPKISAELTNISPNGKWLAVTWQHEYYTPGGTGYSQTRFPAFIDLENDKAYLFEDLPGGARHATNEGLGFTIDGLMTNSGKVIDIETGAVIGNHANWIKENYGIATSPGSIVYMTPDMQRFLCLYLASSAMGAKTTHWFVAPRPRE